MKKRINNFDKPVDWSSMGNEIFQIKPDLNFPILYRLETLGYKSMTPSNWVHVNLIKFTFNFCQTAHIFGKKPF